MPTLGTFGRAAPGQRQIVRRAEPPLTAGRTFVAAMPGQGAEFPEAFPEGPARPAEPVPAITPGPHEDRAWGADACAHGAHDPDDGDPWDPGDEGRAPATVLSAAMAAAKGTASPSRPAAGTASAHRHAAAQEPTAPMLAGQKPTAPASPSPLRVAEITANAGGLFRSIRPQARERALARALQEPPPVSRAPHDPAPSRLSYRMERLWLTPVFRVFMRVGVPVLIVTAALAVWLGDHERRDAIGQRLADLRTQFENRPEFMVRLMSVEGASQPVADAVRDMLPLRLPASSFQIDIDAFRAAIEQVDAVESASVKVGANGVLNVEITERKPAVLWRTDTTLEMLDASGHRVATLLDRSARADLPVIAGQGAEDHVPEALMVLAAAGPLLPRVRGLVRMGERRWDMVLDRDQRVLLPETEPVRAIEHAVALDGAEELFARDVAAFDLRLAQRPTLRLTDHAVVELQKLTESLTRVVDQ